LLHRVPKPLCACSFPNQKTCQSPPHDVGEIFAFAAVYGVDAYQVEIEVNNAGSDPAIVVVGLPDTAVKESRDRVTTAVANSGYYWPRGRTTVNLAPADIKKEGPSFDLPIALGMIAVCEEIDTKPFADLAFVGELALDGAVRPVKGVLPVAIEARRRGKRALFVPEANAREAAMVDSIDISGVQNLRQTFGFLRGELPCTDARRSERIFRHAPKLRRRF
jgi:magnesium chelatase family protein